MTYSGGMRPLVEIAIVLLAVAVVLIGLLYAVTPIIVRRRFALDPHPAVTVVREEQLPPDALHFFEESASDFARIGFSPRTYLHVSGYTPAQTLDARLHVDALGYTATAACIRQQAPGRPERVVRVVTFSALHDDGREVSTTNSQEAELPVADRQTHPVPLPGVWDLALMYLVHRHEDGVFAPETALVVSSPGEEAQAMADGFARSTRRMVKAGRLRLDPVTGEARLTWRGAYLLSWSLLPPARQIRQARIQARAERAIESARAASSSRP